MYHQSGAPVCTQKAVISKICNEVSWSPEWRWLQDHRSAEYKSWRLLNKYTASPREFQLISRRHGRLQRFNQDIKEMERMQWRSFINNKILKRKVWEKTLLIWYWQIAFEKFSYITTKEASSCLKQSHTKRSYFYSNSKETNYIFQPTQEHWKKRTQNPRTRF